MSFSSTLTFEDERAAAHRLAGFGGGLEVVSPDGVRGLLLAAGRELLDRYGRPSSDGAPDGRAGLSP